MQCKKIKAARAAKDREKAARQAEEDALDQMAAKVGQRSFGFNRQDSFSQLAEKATCFSNVEEQAADLTSGLGQEVKHLSRKKLGKLTTSTASEGQERGGGAIRGA